MVLDKVVPSESLVFSSYIGKNDRDAGVEIGALVITGVKEENRVAVAREMRSRRGTAGTGAHDDVVVGVIVLWWRRSCDGPEEGEDDGDEMKLHGPLYQVGMWSRWLP